MEINDCPMCGNPPEQWTDLGDKTFNIKCCGLQIFNVDKEAAISCWNGKCNSIEIQDILLNTEDVH